MEEFESTRKLPKSPATERSAASVSTDVEEVTPECMYNDQTDFVGGDLPKVFHFFG